MRNKDSKLSLLQYWNKHKFALADELNWKCDGAVNGLCPDANGDKCWKHAPSAQSGASIAKPCTTTPALSKRSTNTLRVSTCGI